MLRVFSKFVHVACSHSRILRAKQNGQPTVSNRLTPRHRSSATLVYSFVFFLLFYRNIHRQKIPTKAAIYWIESRLKIINRLFIVGLFQSSLAAAASLELFIRADRIVLYNKLKGPTKSSSYPGIRVIQ